MHKGSGLKIRYSSMPDNHILGMPKNADIEYVVKTLMDIIYWCRRENKDFLKVLRDAQLECDFTDYIEESTGGTFGIVPFNLEDTTSAK